MPTSRTIKRVLISFIYIMIPIVILTVVFFIQSDKPTCFDGKQNQNESGIDCGGVCAPCVNFSNAQELLVRNTEFVFGGNGTYDGLIKIENPNANTGSPSFSYKASLKDSEGNVIDEIDGRSFVLPSEIKSIVLTGFTVSENQVPAKLDFEVINLNWSALPANNKPVISISNKKFSPAESGVGGEAYGVVKIETPLGLKLIRVKVILRDSSNKVVGLNSTQMNTVYSGKERDFKLSWTYELPGEVSNVEIETETDVYNSTNFIN